MKLTNFALSALGMAGFVAAQNGNDPLILNNRTGLHPTVYDNFSTSYTNKPAATFHSVPLTPSPERSNTYMFKPTTSVKCWRNGYPCGQNGGQRSQRLVADFVGPTPAIAARVPPPEWFSSHTDFPLPGETDVPGETGEMPYGILPIPTSLGGEPRTSDASNAPGKTGEAIFSVSPTTTSTPAADKSPIPTAWWRGLTSGFAGPHEPTPIAEAGEPYAVTIDCNRHYCISGMPTIRTITPTPHPYPVLPPATSGFAVPSKPTLVNEARDAFVPVDWWRGPGKPVVPDAPKGLDGIYGPIEQTSSVESVFSVATNDPCFRHYCPSGYTPGAPDPTTMLTETKPVVTQRLTKSPVLSAIPPSATSTS
ncbi:uncharacterized protein M421DRAFT_422402 [Didymella exigua CBS 183.55]|uniref:Lytic polysaccharide monooxygenase n=1 Tax=Didymella exigua CBS 183.55 TaxID=1150837 RepID=A0A6A5REV3_9PLEO|nr:uncharacterized protein M421DRAFT_422402 [Didymella exigua CBS 183.55]KAF1926795.1 hypothetical protein M421DRAFT_422402 [Didymella exigua CBS 183.55]